MGRIGVTKDDVFKTCEKIVAAGQPVTVANVRYQLGAGSYSTLLPFITEYKETAHAATQEPTPEAAIPDGLASSAHDFVSRLWGVAKAQANQEIESIRIEASRLTESARNETIEKTRELEQVIGDVKRYEHELEELKAQLKSSRGWRPQKGGRAFRFEKRAS